jgi:hypothetical protein
MWKGRALIGAVEALQATCGDEMDAVSVEQLMGISRNKCIDYVLSALQSNNTTISNNHRRQHSLHDQQRATQYMQTQDGNQKQKLK